MIEQSRNIIIGERGEVFHVLAVLLLICFFLLDIFLILPCFSHMPQCFDRVKPRCLEGRTETGQNSHCHNDRSNDQDIG